METKRLMEIRFHPLAEEKMMHEPSFEIFKHAGLICCVCRMASSGTLNGYVSVSEGHPLFSKEYSDCVIVENIHDVEFNGNYIGLLCKAFDAETPSNVIALDLALNVHGGITYSRDYLLGISEELFGKLWWFGFDTGHAGDLRPYRNFIDRKYDIDGDAEYRDFEYVKEETKKLADQLAKFINPQPATV